MIKSKIKTILVPLDGSPNSFRGLDTAISIARHCQAIIKALYVKEVPGVYALHPLGFIGYNDTSEARKFLEDAKVRAAKRGILLKPTIIKGEAGYDVVKFSNAPKNKVDLVVIGARGRNAAKEILFGSTSNYVIHKAKKPVLVVR